MAGQSQVTSDELLAVIDDAVYTAGASDFGIVAMDTIWKIMCEDEGITPAQGLNRRDPSLRSSKLGENPTTPAGHPSRSYEF